MTDEPTPWFKDHPEFVPEWDVARYPDGTPITITEEQGHAILRAIRIVQSVERTEGGSCGGVWEKSRLLGRILYEGLPPTRTKPPHDMGAPWWPLLPGGDPFVSDEEKQKQSDRADELLAAGKLRLVCYICGYDGPTFTSRQDREDHMTTEHSENPGRL